MAAYWAAVSSPENVTRWSPARLLVRQAAAFGLLLAFLSLALLSLAGSANATASTPGLLVFFPGVLAGDCDDGGFEGRLVNGPQGTEQVFGFLKCPGFNTFLQIIYGIKFNPKTKKYEAPQQYQKPGNSQAAGQGTNGNRGSGGGAHVNLPAALAAPVSAGEYIVGFQDNGPNTPYHAFRTTSDTNTYLDLGTLDSANANAFSAASDVSDDGSVVAGFSDFNNGATQHAFRWTQAGGMVDLGSGKGASGFSRALGVSGDGNTAVGDSDFPTGPRSPFLWTQVGGFVNLAPGGCGGLADAITGDASVAVGEVGGCSNNSTAFRWTSGGLLSIGALSGDTSAAATGVSDNGKVVIGISAPRPLTRGNLGWDYGTDTHAFRWTASAGMKELGSLLGAAGVDMTGITIVAVTGISPDGQFIVGEATTPKTQPNETASFIAQYCDADIGAACVPWIAAHDINGDSNSDILWRNANSGAAGGWLMHGSAVLQASTFATVPTPWKIVAERDFDGDGKADLLWRNTSTGALALWLMNGLSVKQAFNIGIVPLHWVVAGASDFNADGKADILWRDTTTGTVAIWLMNGATVVQPGNVGAVASNWTIAGTDAFGMIVWRNTTSGAVALWSMNGFKVAQSVSFGSAPAVWSIAALGDFDRNGWTDLLWRNASTGAVAIWFMDDSGFMKSASLGTVASAWSVAATGDFDGDGKSDIVWTNAGSGARAIWFMNGAHIASTASLGTVATAWVIQSMGNE